MRVWRDKGGSFTLEASLVFPLLFYTVIILMFFCLYLYQNTLLGQAAAVAAERSAYSWDNSQRDDVTGAFEEGANDSLYWRLADDGMLQTIFGWDGGSGAAKLSLPAKPSNGESLPLRKLSRTGSKVPESIRGEMRYDNRLLLRKVSVELERLVPLAPLQGWLDNVNQKGRAEAYVVEPVEWIRTVELARYYGAKFKRGGADGMNKQEAQNALKLFGK